jgi:segregation and condensation protein B
MTKRRKAARSTQAPAEVPPRDADLNSLDGGAEAAEPNDGVRDAEREPSASLEGQSSEGASVEGEAPVAAEPDSEPEDTQGFLLGLLEALLFVSDKPLELKEIARAARLDRKRTEELLEALQEQYRGRGLTLECTAGGYAFRTAPLYAKQVQAFLAQRPVRLSRAQLETLAIVAYRQPITRPEIDDIRGVDSGPVLKGLLERELVRILGKKDEPGRPVLYGTAPPFIELFGINSLSELPTLREFTELTGESRDVFERETGEAPPHELEADEARVADEPALGSDQQGLRPEAEDSEKEADVEASAAP